MMNTFVTETDVPYVRQQSYKGLGIAFLVMSGFACIGLCVAWQTFAFFEGIVFISCVVTAFLQTRKSHDYVLDFQGDRLLITDRANGNRYEVFDIPASNFVITQSKKEKTINYCSVLIKNTVFAFGGVKNCGELKAYIAANFKSV